MKKRGLSIVVLSVWGATQCFGQDPNFNTTYGGIVQDQFPSPFGQFVPNPTANGNGFYNSAFGFNALGPPSSSVSGQANCAFGFQALTNLTSGGGNTGIGANALMSLQNIFQNTSTGQNSLLNLTGGGNNSAYGYNSMYSLGTGTWNCAFGIGTMLGITSGDNNTAIGGQSQNAIAGSSSDNTSVGFRSLFSPAAGSQFNTAIGEQAMYSPLGSVLTNNTAVGYQALFTSGGSGSANNTAIGHQALFNNQTGSNNTALGFLADVTSGTLTNATAIGANAKVANNNSMELGDNTVNVGIGLSGPGLVPSNRLEISTQHSASSVPCNSNFTSTFSNTLCTGQTGSSGLRFRDLTHASGTYSYQGNSGFLTVDDNGDVVLMQAPSGNGIGAGYCSNGPLPILTSNAGYDLHNSANFYFAGNNGGTGVNNVNIGYNCSTPNVLAKLNVLQHSGGANSIGILVRNADLATSTSTPIGIKAAMPLNNNPGSPSVAGWFEANHAPGNKSYSIFIPDAGTQNNRVGVVSIGFPLGILPTSTVIIGSPRTTLLYVAGDAIAYGYRILSDRAFKTDLTPLKNALEKIKTIRPCYYYYDTVKYAKYQFPVGKQVGFIAQNVDSVMPEAVQRSDDGYSMDYSKMTPLLLAGIQEQQEIITRNNLSSVSQQKTIDSLRTALNNMQACISKLCAASVQNNGVISATNVQNVSLSASAILYQNAPNPFDQGGTKINYFLPEGTVGASIIFYDNYGNKLKEVELTQTGMGTVSINPVQLTSGLYTYSLLINGNVVDTKKMVFSK